MSDMYDWANREVKLFYDKNKDEKEKFNYVGECALSALKAYKSLLDDGHSGMSISVTKMILDDLIDGRPLTPIEDTPDVWNEVGFNSSDETVYQCKRMASLFKHVKKDGTIIFRDNDYVSCREKFSRSTYYSGFVSNIIYELYPITLPYFPNRHYEVITREFLSDKKNGDFDHEALLELYLNGKRVDNFRPRYYDLTHDEPVEISLSEFNWRLEKRVDTPSVLMEDEDD